jgi:hypothetical protein
MARTKDHLAQVHEAEALVDEVESARDALRDDARRTLGVTGVTDAADDQPPTLRNVLQRYGLGVYPMIAIGVLGIVDQFQGYAFAVLTPEISRALGIGKGVIAGIIALKTLAVAVAPLPMAALAQRRGRRAFLCLITAVLWSIVAISTGFVLATWGLVLVLVADGLSTGSVGALHQPLLLDSYPPEGRVRVLSTYQGFVAFGNIISPLLVALCAAVLGFTWRGVFVVLGCVSLGACLAALRLRDPGFGRWETEAIRRRVREHHGEGMAGVAVTDEDLRLGFFETVRRLTMIPTVRRLLLGLAVFGVLLVPYETFLFFFLEERWDMGPGARGVFFAFTAAVSIGALILFGRAGEARFRQDPGALTRFAGGVVAVAVVCIGLGGLSPWFWGMVLMFSLSSAMVTIVAPSLDAALLAVIPSEMRPHAGALRASSSAASAGSSAPCSCPVSIVALVSAARWCRW